MACSRLVISDCQCPSWPYVGKWCRLLRNRTLISIASLWSGSIWSSLDGSWHCYLALQLWHSSAVLESLLWQLLWWVMQNPIVSPLSWIDTTSQDLILEVWHAQHYKVIKITSSAQCSLREAMTTVIVRNIFCLAFGKAVITLRADTGHTHCAYYVCVFQKLGIFLQELVNAFSKPCHMSQWNRRM